MELVELEKVIFMISRVICNVNAKSKQKKDKKKKKRHEMAVSVNGKF